MLPFSPLKVWGEFSPKELFMGDFFWTNLCGSKLTVVHWCVTAEGRGSFKVIVLGRASHEGGGTVFKGGTS